MKRSIVLTIACIAYLISWSQDFVFEKITTQNGLSQNDVNCIFQDHNGFLWIGTNDGLNRYDGYQFRTYRTGSRFILSKGLSSNLISRIDEDISGNLWIATPNEGVCKFDVSREHFVPFRNTLENPNRIAHNRILDVKCMSDGSVWLATQKGVTIISETDGNVQIKSLDSLISNFVITERCQTLAQDKLGRIWLGRSKGLIVLEKCQDGYHAQSIPEFEQLNVREIKLSESGFFVNAGNGIYLLNSNSEDVNGVNVERISRVVGRTLLLGQNNMLYVGSNQGLYICKYFSGEKTPCQLYAHVKEGFTASDLNRNVVQCLFEDLSGNIWVGTNGGGLNRYNPARKKFFHFKANGLPGSLSNNKIRSIFEDSDHNIWIGTEGGGINFHEGNEKLDFNSGFIQYQITGHIGENSVYAIRELQLNGKNRIWAGTGYPNWLLQFETPVKGKLVAVDDQLLPKLGSPVFSMLKDREGNMWLGTYGQFGLYKYVVKGSAYELYNYQEGEKEGDLSSNTIRSLLQDRYGNIWIGTDAGLNLLPYSEIHKEKPRFRVFRNIISDSTSLTNNYILALHESKDGTLWIGTMGGGLNRLQADPQMDQVSFGCFDKRDGLPNDVIKGILEDDKGNLWISSNKGLSCFNPVNKEIMNFDPNDGVQDYEFGELACCKLSNGMMLFGGVNGFNAFYPDQIAGDTILPRVAFTDFQVLNQSASVGAVINNRVLLEKVVNETEVVKLKYSENSFSIYFSALHFTAPQKNQYKYMLEGFDSDWIIKNSTERIAKYTSLKPGKYTFKLYASNNDGVWSKKPKTLTVIVVPPWWQSDLAIALYLIMFVLILWFFQRYSIIRIKQKNELLMEHFEKEKAEELAQMKLRFFTNISHEFRTPLTLITGAIQKLIKSNNNLPVDVQERHRIIQRHSAVMLRLINQLMDFRKMEQDKLSLTVSEEDLILFVKNIYQAFVELAADKDIAFNLNVPAEHLQAWFDADKVEKILYNLLSNAFKFTPNGGQIDLLVELTDHEYQITVKDNGIGIPVEMQPHIFERFYQANKLKPANFSGTGIGLSYSKGLAQLQHGDIRFSSIEGQGSSFILIIKRGRAHFQFNDFLTEKQIGTLVRKPSEPIELIDLPKVENPTLPTQTDRNKRYSLLIVEDNPDLLSFLADNFKREYQIYTADNGQIGIDVAMDNEVDLIVSDVNMPMKSGFELCEEVKSNEKISHIPVILLTAKSTAEDTIAGYQSGADAYVVKPFDITVLEAQIKSILDVREELKMKFRKAIEVVPSEVTTTNADEKFLAKLISIVEENIMNSEFSVEQLANEYGLSQIIINKKLKSLTGHTANTFIRNLRLKRACQLLKTGRYAVADVTYEVGFSDLKYFRSCFKKEYDMTPSEYVKSWQDDKH